MATRDKNRQSFHDCREREANAQCTQPVVSHEESSLVNEDIETSKHSKLQHQCYDEQSSYPASSQKDS